MENEKSAEMTEESLAPQETFTNKGRRRLGIAKGKKFFAEGYDLDDCNDEIAEMFGLNE